MTQASFIKDSDMDKCKSKLIVGGELLRPHVPQTGPNFVDTSEGDITPECVHDGKIGFAKGEKIIGSYVALDTSDGTIVPETVIKNEVGYSNGERIVGSYEPLDTSDGTITPETVLDGEIGYSHGERIVGAVPKPQQPGQLSVRFISPVPDKHGNVVIKEVFVNRGGSVALPPVPNPDSAYLIPDGWTHDASDLSNIQYDMDVGALYRTVDGKTYFWGETTAGSGYILPFRFSMQSGTGVFRIEWGDGTTQDIGTGSGSLSFDKNFVGKYSASIQRLSGDGVLGLGANSSNNFIHGNNPAETLKRLYIGDSVIFGANGFVNGNGVDTFVFQRGFDGFGTGGSMSEMKNLKSLVIPPGTTALNGNNFQRAFPLEAVVLSHGIKTLETNVLSDTFSLSRAVIPDSVEVIGNSVLSNAYSMTSFVLKGDNLTSIGTYVGNSSRSLRTLILTGIANIPSDCFRYMTALQSLTLDDKIEQAGSNALSIDKTCRVVECHAVIPPSIPSSMLGGLLSTAKIYVPDASIEAYKQATNWLTRANQILPMSSKPTG